MCKRIYGLISLSLGHYIHRDNNYPQSQSQSRSNIIVAITDLAAYLASGSLSEEFLFDIFFIEDCLMPDK